MGDRAKDFYRCHRNVIRKSKNQNRSSTYIKIMQSTLGALVGFKGFLRVRGVGYRFQIEGQKLMITVGYSHNLEVKLPFNQEYTLNKKSTFLRVKGANLVFLSNFLSSVRKLRKPDVYKGKGIRYQKDLNQFKEGKKKKTA